MSDEPVLTNSERALKAAMVALDYIASQAGLYHSNSIDQARQAKVAIEDILGSPSQVPTAEQEIETLRMQLAHSRRNNSELVQLVIRLQSGGELLAARTEIEGLQNSLEQARDEQRVRRGEFAGGLQREIASLKGDIDTATEQTARERRRADLLQEMVEKSRVYAESLENRLYIHEASDAFKRQQLLALSRPKGKKAKKCDQSSKS